MTAAALAQAVRDFRSGSFAAARLACDRYLLDRPHDHRAHQLLALIGHETGDGALALAHMARAIELAPDNAGYHANQGAILHATGDDEAALAAYRRAQDSDPATPGIHNAIAVLLDALGRPAEAADAYRLALADSPDDAGLYLGLGGAQRAAGDSSGALESTQTSLSLDPDDPDAHYNLAIVLLDNGRHAEARASLLEASKRGPDIAVYRIALGKAEKALGNEEDANMAFRTALTLDPTGETYNLAGTVDDIDAALARGNLARAEQRCRFAAADFPACPWWPYYRAEVALRLNMRDQARQLLARTRQAITDCAPVRFDTLESRLAEAERKTAALKPVAAPAAPSYLLIKCWGYGFWSDVSHVLSSLLLAEMTGRIPVIHWGANSYYSDDTDRDAFSTFFQPPNDLALADIASGEFDYFPGKWHAGNLATERRDIWFGADARQSGLYLLNRPERVAVSEFYTQLAELLPWLDPEHPLAGTNVAEAYRTLYRKYIRLQPAVQREVDGFIEPNFGTHPTVGVHIRNIDKGLENTRFEEDRAKVMPIVERLVAENPDLRIFLLTDTTEALENWQRRFGDRVFNADCARTDSEVPLTWRNDVNSHFRLGVEIIRDTYAAAACDQFVGLGCSNVAGMVTTLKHWRDEDLHMIGEISLLRENWMLHDW